MKKNSRFDRKSSIRRQAEVCFGHTRRNSHSTRNRYEASSYQFIDYLDAVFKLQNLRNLHDKHVVAYIKMRQECGIAAKTIKNDLAAIRYLHGLVQNPRYEISDNNGLANVYGMVLERTPAANGDRAWTNEEFDAMLQLAANLGRTDITDAMSLTKECGFRVTEAVAMSRAQCEKALRTGIYPIKGEAKNGKHRDVPLSDKARAILQRRLKDTPRGGKVFVGPDEKVHHVVNRMQQFIIRHRDKVITEQGNQGRVDFRDGESRSLTFHGMRYNYVQARMEEEMSRGLDEEVAARNVTKEVGHNRTQVIKVYQGG
ncbi:phage integrase N-terminal domain-containing protein [Bacillus sp. 3255]|uniref:tyrosine-type recombinase/integrase n=1 Tax=Bacillus sp. 3255 TaxID=2817904 RepID=UPI0028565579|nr:phage integrase N-terminal domain-containing protein [Bacillus sp. 3255]MDR6884326.1 integrase [Bacillus sp. 3255]